MNLWNVAQFTFRDLIRSKIMWNIPVLGLLVAIITFVSQEFTYGAPERVATNMGLAVLTLSVYGIAFFAGVTLIRSEAESRTIYLIISRPVSRATFFLGKVSGVCLFLTLNIIILASISTLIMWLNGGWLNSQIIVTMLFILLEAVMLLVAIVVLSLVSNMALTLMFGFILLVAGHAVAVTQNILWLERYPIVKTALGFYHWVFPAFFKLNFKEYAVYSNNFPWQNVGTAAGYWFFYTVALLLLGCGIMNDKDFD